MKETTKFIIFWSLPLTALFIVLRAQIVRVVLGSGLFDWNDTRLTAAAFALFAVSGVFQCLTLLFIRGFYSAGFTKKPFYINLFSTIFLIVSTYGLVKVFYSNPEFRMFIGSLLKVEDLQSIVVLMLPLGFSVAAILNGIIHFIIFQKEFKGFAHGLSKTLFECLGASLITGFVTYLGLNFFAPILDTTSLLGIFLQGALAGTLGIVTGIFVLWLLKSEELEIVWKTIHERFWKTKIIATDPEII